MLFWCSVFDWYYFFFISSNEMLIVNVLLIHSQVPKSEEEVDENDCFVLDALECVLVFEGTDANNKEKETTEVISEYIRQLERPNGKDCIYHMSKDALKIWLLLLQIMVEVAYNTVIYEYLESIEGFKASIRSIEKNKDFVPTANPNKETDAAFEERRNVSQF